MNKINNSEVEDQHQSRLRELICKNGFTSLQLLNKIYISSKKTRHYFYTMAQELA